MLFKRTTDVKGDGDKNKSERAGSLLERSALSTSALASVLPLTFDYCGAKPASTEFDSCIISAHPCVWINRITCAQLWACARLCWMKALPGIVTPGFTFLCYHYYYYSYQARIQASGRPVP